MGNISDKPPKTLWQACKLAKQDVEKTRDNDRYDWSMDGWHEPMNNLRNLEPDGLVKGADLKITCFICIAGAVIAETLEGSPTELLCPNDFDNNWPEVLEAIDAARIGDIEVAVLYFSGAERDELEELERAYDIAMNSPQNHGWSEAWDKFTAVAERLDI